MYRRILDSVYDNEKIRVNTIINQVLRLNGEDIKRSSVIWVVWWLKMAEPIKMLM